MCSLSAHMLNANQTMFSGHNDWNQHLVDLVSILDHCKDSRNPQTADSNGLACFVYSRAYSKVAARLDNGRRMWDLGDGKHVLEYIHTWYEEPSRAPTSSSVSIVGYLPPVFSQLGLLPDSEGKIPLNAGNVRQWTKLISNIYAELKFLYPLFKRTNTQVPTSAQIIQLHVTLIILHTLLDEGVFKALLTRDLVEDLDKRCRWNQGKVVNIHIDWYVKLACFLAPQQSDEDDEAGIIIAYFVCSCIY